MAYNIDLLSIRSPWRLSIDFLKSGHHNVFEVRAPVDFIYVWPILKWVPQTSLHGKVLGEYHKISNIRGTKFESLMFLVSSCMCLCPIHWSQLLSREWRCSWSSADRRCFNYIWVINDFIAYYCSTYIRGLTVHHWPPVNLTQHL